MALYRRVASKTSFHGTISHRMYQLSPKVITRRHPSRRPFRWRVRRLNPPQSTQPAGFVRLSFGGNGVEAGRAPTGAPVGPKPASAG